MDPGLPPGHILNIELTRRWVRMWRRVGLVVLGVFVLRALYHLYIPLHGPYAVAARAYPQQFRNAAHADIGLCVTCVARRIKHGDATTYRFTLTVDEAGRATKLVEADVVEGGGGERVMFRERR